MEVCGRRTRSSRKRDIVARWAPRDRQSNKRCDLKKQLSEKHQCAYYSIFYAARCRAAGLGYVQFTHHAAQAHKFFGPPPSKEVTITSFSERNIFADNRGLCLPVCDLVVL
jgi:hypothetical protein